ncbi:MAG: 6-carboxytetrahydropterin synthase, partial [Parvularculaceae bacterium]|nr:6-carboxytetrahydropterin synthase [Parvularculaceae bacterium]
MRIVKSINFDAAHFLPALGAESPAPYQRMHGHSFTLEI